MRLNAAYEVAFNLMIYQPPFIGIYSTNRQLMIYQKLLPAKNQVDRKMCFFRVEASDLPRFLGALFLLVCFCFSKPKNKGGFWGEVFCLFLFCYFSETSSLKRCQNTEKSSFPPPCLCLAGSFSFSSNPSTIQTERNKIRTKHNNKT